MLIKELIKLSAVAAVTLFLFPIRYLLVFGLWVGILSNSSFIVTMLVIVGNKIFSTLTQIFYSIVVGVLYRRKDLQVEKVEFPLKGFYNLFKKYVKTKFLERPSCKQNIDESLFDNVGEEHSDRSPFSNEKTNQ